MKPARNCDMKTRERITEREKHTDPMKQTTKQSKNKQDKPHQDHYLTCPPEKVLESWGRVYGTPRARAKLFMYLKLWRHTRRPPSTKMLRGDALLIKFHIFVLRSPGFSSKYASLQGIDTACLGSVLFLFSCLKELHVL